MRWIGIILSSKFPHVAGKKNVVGFMRKQKPICLGLVDKNKTSEGGLRAFRLSLSLWPCGEEKRRDDNQVSALQKYKIRKALSLSLSLLCDSLGR